MIEHPDPAEVTLQHRAHHEQTQLVAPFGQLVVLLEGRLVRTLVLNSPVITIGRSPANGLPLDNRLVSRAHAELRSSAEAVILTDVGSANGTFVGDTRLVPHQPVVLVPGSLVRIGPFVLRYEAAARGQPQPPAEPAIDDPATAEPLPLPSAAFTPAAAPRLTWPAPLPEADGPSIYLDFLPALFQDADFLGRFLLIFESIWEPLEQRQDHMALYFDPSTCPAQFLYWLAAWLGLMIGPQTEEGRLRALLSEAVELHRWRGTRYGLTRLLEICTGVTPLISEVASNRALLHIRIALPPEAAVDRDAIERIVRANKPAHAGYLLEIIS